MQDAGSKEATQKYKGQGQLESISCLKEADSLST